MPSFGGRQNAPSSLRRLGVPLDRPFDENTQDLQGNSRFRLSAWGSIESESATLGGEPIRAPTPIGSR